MNGFRAILRWDLGLDEAQARVDRLFPEVLASSELKAFEPGLLPSGT